ncbi:hypothetical protein JW935_26825 [candidate division KSB1 bacterium]|nr:hypothetical protein [candidate division KSB1 bacterium]
MAKSSKKRGFWRKITRVLFYLGLSFVLLFCLLFIFLQYFVPNEKIKQLTIQSVEKSLHRKLIIEKFELAPFRGFDLAGITLMPMSDSSKADDFPVKNARISNAVLKYSLLDLLKRKITINKILIDSLFLDLDVGPVSQNSAVQEITVDTLQMDPLAEINLPIALDLNSASLRNINVNFQMEDSLYSTAITLGKINFLVDDLSLSKGNLLDSTAVSNGKVKLFTNPTDFRILQKDKYGSNIEVAGKLLFNLDLVVNNLDSIQATINTRLEKLWYKDINQELTIPAVFSVQIDLFTDYLIKKAIIEPFGVKVDDKQWINARATINDFDTRPLFDLVITRGVIPVQQLLDLASAVLPDSVNIPIDYLFQGAVIDFSGSTVSGAAPDDQNGVSIAYNFLLNLKNLGFRALEQKLLVQNLNISAHATGSLDQSLNTVVSVSYDSLNFVVNDSTDFYSGFFELDINSTIGPDFIPLDNKLSLSIQNLFGAKLDGNLHLTGTNSVQNLKGKAEFNLIEINSEQFPQLPVQTQGALTFGIRLATLDTINLSTTFKTTPLLYVFEDEIEVLPKIDLNIDAFCNTDSTFEIFNVQSLTMQLNDFFDLNATAQLRDEFTVLNAKMEQLRVYHEPIWNAIPEVFKQDIEDLTVSGSTVLTGGLNARVGDEVQYDLFTQLKTEKTSIAYPEQFISLNGFNVDIRADAYSDRSTKVRFDLSIDTTRADVLNSGLFLNNAFGFEIELAGIDRVLLKKGRLSVPAFNGVGSFHGVVAGLLDENPNGQIVFNFVQNAVDTMRLGPGIFVRGRSEINLNCFFDSRFLDMYANVATKNLDIFAGDDIKISQMNSNIYLKQKYDIINVKLFGSELSPLPTPSDGVIDYMVYKPYFIRSLEDISSLEIKQIDAVGYVVENLSVEMYLGDGRIEIPKLYTDVYGGNINGRISVDLAGGELSEAEFEISSHFSGINSALLTPEYRRKRTKGVINGSMHLNGTGLDPEKNINVEGFINLTEIEPRVADNILRSMDPEGIDTSIKSTRKLIKMGAKPTLFSFRLQHGFSYPSISLSQPLLFPVKISGKSIGLNRLPIEFFLQMSRQLSIEGG